MPTVSPGCVTDPARAGEIPPEINSAPVVAIAANLFCILPPMEMLMTAASLLQHANALYSAGVPPRDFSTIFVGWSQKTCEESTRRLFGELHVIVMRDAKVAGFAYFRKATC